MESTSWWKLESTFWWRKRVLGIRVENVFKTSWRHLQRYIFLFSKTPSRRVAKQEMFARVFSENFCFYYCDTGKKKKSMFLVLRRIQNLVNYLVNNKMELFTRIVTDWQMIIKVLNTPALLALQWPKYTK